MGVGAYITGRLLTKPSWLFAPPTIDYLPKKIESPTYEKRSQIELNQGRDIPALRTGREGPPSSGSLQGNLHSLLPLISSLYFTTSWGFTGDPRGSLGLGQAAIPYLLTQLYSSSHWTHYSSPSGCSC
ncbi:hypothetical protein Lal_00015142 [Lupinus albus]|nr:hypothetical protein Lal_00038479 [Lupinus albus]KAF1891546.1 hypothetical protein Lal_00015142 [Lupinus albus]